MDPLPAYLGLVTTDAVRRALLAPPGFVLAGLLLPAIRAPDVLTGDPMKVPVVAPVARKFSRRTAPRLIYLSEETAREIGAYVATYRVASDPSALFTGPRGRITYGVMGKIAKDIGRAANVPHFSWHRARHRMIDAMLDQRAPLPAIQAVAGHARAETTVRYASLRALRELTEREVRPFQKRRIDAVRRTPAPEDPSSAGANRDAGLTVTDAGRGQRKKVHIPSRNGGLELSRRFNGGKARKVRIPLSRLWTGGAPPHTRTGGLRRTARQIPVKLALQLGYAPRRGSGEARSKTRLSRHPDLQSKGLALVGCC